MSNLKLGLLTAILPNMTFEEAILYAKSKGLSSVELACWPKQKESRRYAGTSHFNADDLSEENIIKTKKFLKINNIEISSLGYYPNPLNPNPEIAEVAISHINKLINAAKALDVNMVTTFIGRNKLLSHAENMDLFVKIWKPIIEFAEAQGVNIAIENCPMYFTYDEYPGGLNLATSPAIFKEMFERIPNANFGLNFDPSHFVWQHMDYISVLETFKDRLFHIHIKDVKLDKEKLNFYGNLVPPLFYMSPKLPGLGNIDWKKFLDQLEKIEYKGHMILEIEDKAFESSFELTDFGITQSINYIKKLL
jgi:sugar phosphate isomerase/epimerase